MDPEHTPKPDIHLQPIAVKVAPSQQVVGLRCGNHTICCPGSPVCTVFPSDGIPSPATYADLIGKKFQWGGRGPEVYDCIGLVKEVFRRSGLEIPDYPSSTEAKLNALVILAAMEKGWLKLPEPCRAGMPCAVTFRMDRRDSTHVGAVVGPDMFLHISESTACVRERLSHPLWRRRITGYFRWLG